MVEVHKAGEVSSMVNSDSMWVANPNSNNNSISCSSRILDSVGHEVVRHCQLHQRSNCSHHILDRVGLGMVCLEVLVMGWEVS